MTIERLDAPVLAALGVVAVAATATLAGSLTAGDQPGRAVLAATEASQVPADRLDAGDVARLVVDPVSTRLLVATAQGAHFVARTPSGELCLVRVPAGGQPTEACVPDRVGADATIGQQGAGQVRLVADGGRQPALADGWRPAGPNVWVRD